ncbi:uncharacterized protein ACA1_228920 [Acanthamoeba castellanii str. Neff]|uniref:BAG domain-containing protein n=1 Tax=Acanthamoeba castellanii (strain ATCC 30010 / Neff) TaxID=1257118 RepID=L8HB65_ACACF|nr:uncharacterized protein ACA1_228920 [Acanthamoeba castellanii str. Neff]ELR21611.1 hypothetical protein ACA1_228920 [Acanthamoeba castellanii str. Neff]
MGGKPSTPTGSTASAAGPIKPPQVQFYLRNLRRLEEEVLPEEERKVQLIEQQAKIPIDGDEGAPAEAKEKDGEDGNGNGTSGNNKITEAERREKERLLAYEGLMRKLVETDGYSADDDDLRRKRKEVVASIQSLMDRLEALRPPS